MQKLFPGCLVIFILITFAGPRVRASGLVVIYTSADQVFSEPILKHYETISGVTVKAVYDVEAAKTVGLVNRLIAEKNNPQADVFWNSEIARTIALKERGLLVPYISPSAGSCQRGNPNGQTRRHAFPGSGWSRHIHHSQHSRPY